MRSHVPDFRLNERNAAAVAKICRSLDGLPLALELVAPRVETLGVAEVATRLSDRFSLATGSRRSVPERQRTLRSALEWSCSLLTSDEQAGCGGVSAMSVPRRGRPSTTLRHLPPLT